MSSRFPRGAWATTLCMAATAASFAAVAAERPSPRPDPTQIDAAVPPLRHHSALQRYRPLTDEPRRDWRAANAEVARIGGWRAYLREAHTPEPAASAPALPWVPAKPHGHGHPAPL